MGEDLAEEAAFRSDFRILELVQLVLINTVSRPQLIRLSTMPIVTKMKGLIKSSYLIQIS